MVRAGLAQVQEMRGCRAIVAALHLDRIGAPRVLDLLDRVLADNGIIENGNYSASGILAHECYLPNSADPSPTLTFRSIFAALLVARDGLAGTSLAGQSI